MIRKTSALLLSAIIGIAACSDDGSLGGGGQPPGGGGNNGGGNNGGGGTNPTATTVELAGEITSDTTLTADKSYLLKGLVNVKAGATLTIEKGTTIKGEAGSKAILLIEAGAKIMAQGTKDEPIVFTSQAAEGSKRAGDWGGLVILGNAPVNFPGGKGNVEGILSTVQGTQFGGNDPMDNSGVLSYVRVEYSGTILSPDNEVNGVTFGGVGRGTQVDHVQVRHTLDDCFEFFGGTVDAKYLACQHNEDDGFDWDNGFQGRLQFLVLQQDPQHTGEDNGFEGDNDAQGSANLPFSNPTIYNATLIGKNSDVDSTQIGVLLRKNTRATIRNLLVMGFETNLDIRDTATAEGITNPGATPALTIQNSLFFSAMNASVMSDIAYPENGVDKPNKDNDGAFDEVAWVQDVANANSTLDPNIADAFNASAPVFGPATSLTTNAATPPNDGFFDATATYIGAFKDANDKWATDGKWAAWSDK